MQLAPVLGLTVALSAATAAGIHFFMSPPETKTAPDPNAISSSDLKNELRALRESNDSLRKELDGLKNQVRNPVARTVDPESAVPSDEKIRAAIAAYMEEHGGAGEATEASANLPFDAATQMQQLLSLKDGGFGPEGQKIWDDAKKSGKIEELVAAFEAFARQNPDSADAQTVYGSALIQQLQRSDNQMDMGRLGMKADAAFDEALDIDPEHWAARFTKATSLSFWPDALGRKTEAISHFETLVQQQAGNAPQPGYEQTYLFLGNLYEQRGNAEKAREIWTLGVNRHPGNQQLMDKLR